MTEGGPLRLNEFARDEDSCSSTMSATMVKAVKGAAKRLRRDGGGKWTRTLEEASKQVSDSAKANSERMREATDTYIGYATRAASEIHEATGRSREQLGSAVTELLAICTEATRRVGEASSAANECFETLRTSMRAAGEEFASNWNAVNSAALRGTKELQDSTVAVTAKFQEASGSLSKVNETLETLRGMHKTLFVIFMLGWALCVAGVIWIAVDEQTSSPVKVLLLVGGLTLSFALGARTPLLK